MKQNQQKSDKPGLPTQTSLKQLAAKHGLKFTKSTVCRLEGDSFLLDFHYLNGQFNTWTGGPMEKSNALDVLKEAFHYPGNWQAESPEE